MLILTMWCTLCSSWDKRCSNNEDRSVKSFPETWPLNIRACSYKLSDCWLHTLKGIHHWLHRFWWKSDWSSRFTDAGIIWTTGVGSLAPGMTLTWSTGIWRLATPTWARSWWLQGTWPVVYKFYDQFGGFSLFKLQNTFVEQHYCKWISK